MIEFVCMSSGVAEILQESVQWQLLMRHLERKGVVATLWVEGRENPEAVQMPQLEKIKSHLKTCDGSQISPPKTVESASTQSSI